MGGRVAAGGAGTDERRTRRVRFGLAVVLVAALLAPSPFPGAAAASEARATAPKSSAARIARRLGAAGPRREVLERALAAYECGRAGGHFDRSILTVVDYSLPSTKPRLWVIDLAAERLLFKEFVAHGRNSGENLAVSFSNRPGSKQSSLGLFRTDETYLGRHGYSLRLSGLEPGINDLARERAIVIHGAEYVNAGFAAEHGRLGRSWGCPALPQGVHRRVIDAIKGGTALFAYYPERSWLDGSRFLGCDGQLATN